MIEYSDIGTTDDGQPICMRVQMDRDFDCANYRPCNVNFNGMRPKTNGFGNINAYNGDHLKMKMKFINCDTGVSVNVDHAGLTFYDHLKMKMKFINCDTGVSVN